MHKILPTADVTCHKMTGAVAGINVFFSMHWILTSRLALILGKTVVTDECGSLHSQLDLLTSS
jgi:hypothetical protein